VALTGCGCTCAALHCPCTTLERLHSCDQTALKLRSDFVVLPCMQEGVGVRKGGNPQSTAGVVADVLSLSHMRGMHAFD
jgi:hypothetical protein